MNILIACDKFRESLEGKEVSEALKEGILSVQKEAQIRITQIADGGEGSLQVLSDIYHCTPQEIHLTNAVGSSIRSSFGFNPTSKTAILEMASYVGLAELNHDERNPAVASSYGLGQAIDAAVKIGAKHIIIGVGGSASNDGGAGMLRALGFQFLDENQNIIHPAGGNLHSICHIKIPEQPLPTGMQLTIATDVSNPICGPSGATYTYARQKGAPESELEQLEHNMLHFATLIHGISGNDVLQKQGYGAAGGVPLSACELLGALITSGSELIFQGLGLAKSIQESEVVITGEGKIDHQTLNGKAISPIVTSTLEEDKKLFLVCGLYEGSSSELDIHSRYELSSLAKELGLDSFQDASQLCFEAGKRIGKSLKH